MNMEVPGRIKVDRLCSYLSTAGTASTAGEIQSLTMRFESLEHESIIPFLSLFLTFCCEKHCSENGDLHMSMHVMGLIFSQDKSYIYYTLNTVQFISGESFYPVVSISEYIKGIATTMYFLLKDTRY